MKVYSYNSQIPQQIRASLLEKNKSQAEDLEKWKEQKWILDPDDFRDQDTFCLPMKQSLAPILYVDKKLIISIVEIDKNKVPQIKWKSKAQASPEGNPSKSKEVQLIV